jgi:hypothetical protein
MDKTFNVAFICDFMTVFTTIFIDQDLAPEDIAIMAGEYVLGNYGFNPEKLCHDYEVIEV